MNRKLFGLLQPAIDSIKHWYERRKNIEVLSKLDDRALRDIGISRFDIPAVVEFQMKLRDSSRETKTHINVENIGAGHGMPMTPLR